MRIKEAGGLEPTVEAIARIQVGADAPSTHVIAVVDGANAGAVLTTSHSGDYLRTEIAAADLVLISRGDVVDTAPVKSAMGKITTAPVVDARELTQEHLDAIAPRPRTAGAPPPPATAWSYAGAAQLRSRDIDRILETRPDGLYRLSGAVRTETGGIAIEIAGRARETRRIDEPGETRLAALSPGCAVSSRALDLWFSEAVASGSHLLGRFSYR
jgi:hypothetical protein